jgi:hypothetical protein
MDNPAFSGYIASSALGDTGTIPNEAFEGCCLRHRSNAAVFHSGQTRNPIGGLPDDDIGFVRLHAVVDDEIG